MMERMIEKLIKDCGVKSVLDLGCGRSSPLLRFKGRVRIVGIDVIGRVDGYDEYVKGDVLKAREFFGEKSFDMVCALDLIEHLEKEDGYKLIETMERIARKVIVVMTPNGFVPQQGGYYDRHRSGWVKEEFKSLGFEVYGLRGLKFLRKERCEPRSPKVITLPVLKVSEVLLKRFPGLSYHLFCVKFL